MKIVIGADLVPTESNFEYFKNGDIGRIIDEDILNILQNTDERIFNLEVPLTDTEAPIKKCGPNLIAPTDTAFGIKKINLTLLTLANNHITDQGECGLKDTIEVLNKNDIPYVGAGGNITEAQKPYIIEKHNKKIGIYACAEHEFSIAKNTKAGANPFDPLESLDAVTNLKSMCDYVVVLYHGGKEHYRYPSPYLQRVCRKLCEHGADFVVCQHSHCIGCEEKYNGSTIVYGQGNFLFDYSESDFWKTSLLIELEITDKLIVSYIPICKNGNGVRLANESEREMILNEFFTRSEQIKNEGFVEEKYSELADNMLNSYINSVCGVGIMYRCINKLCGHRLKRKIPAKRRLKMINCIECEAHRELFLRGLKNG